MPERRYDYRKIMGIMPTGEAHSFLSAGSFNTLRTANCGASLTVMYMRPTYSPRSPSISIIMPPMKSSTAMVDV